MWSDACVHAVDDDFLALPRRALADAALATAAQLGAEHADFRLERIRSEHLSWRDDALDSAGESTVLGFAVRVVHDGTYGFAAGTTLTVDEAVRVAREAVAVAQVARPLNAEPVVLASEPIHVAATWVSAYEIDPFSVPRSEKLALFGDWAGRLMSVDHVDHVDVGAAFVKEAKYYLDSAGTETTQQRVRTQGEVEVTRVDPTGGFEGMRTLAPPVGRGWEHYSGGAAGGQYDWDSELAAIPELVVEKAKASSIEPGRYDLVIDPSNLWLTIHESIGHATELDRALGYEAAYAGTSFATLDQLGELQYGSEIMHVTGDRTTEHGLASVGFDDDGVATQQWDIIRDGRLVGYQLDRRMTAMHGATLGVERSNGCAFADSPAHVPVQRMANVSLAPSAQAVSTQDLVSQVDLGIYVVGDKSWSIDMQRYNFQFTGQRFYEIRDGRLTGQLRDVAYQATTTEFWNSMEAVGGAETYVLGGAFNCGKAQPGQIAPVSHGCPSALFRGVNILNTQRESGR
jgi:TldD protein